MRFLLCLCLGFLPPAIAQSATEQAYLGDALGLWSSETQSIDERYDWVVSERWRIFPEDQNGVWLYQENTIVASGPGPMPEVMPEPYFQIVVNYRDLGDGLLHTTSYRVADRSAARKVATEPAAEFKREWLGGIACMGQLQSVGAGFWHGGATCPNGYKGGVKVESQSVRAPDYFVNWDRGYDENGIHIWGPADGGYIFNRVEETQ